MLKKCVAAVVPLLLASSLFADSVPKANDEYGDFYKGDKLDTKKFVKPDSTKPATAKPPAP